MRSSSFGTLVPKDLARGVTIPATLHIRFTPDASQAQHDTGYGNTVNLLSLASYFLKTLL
jgi:hypothetical protein